MWPILRIPRWPVLYWATVAVVCAAHVALCHGAATCRGHPPLRPDELMACFVAPFFAGVPAFFDDRRETRNQGIVAMSSAMGFVYGIVLGNLNSGRPHIGHSTGMHGVLLYDWRGVVIYSLLPCVLVGVCLYFYERVTGDLWGMVRGFGRGVGNEKAA